MKKAIFITVRTGSTRLPKKALIKINGETTIERLISRVKNSKQKEEIILCTTTLEEDKILCDIAGKNNIKYFRGPVEDKLMRWLGAVDKFGVDFFVTADGDDLFCEPELIDLAFTQAEKTKADFIESPEVACGAFTYGIKAGALRKVCEIKDTTETEMMWTYFKDTGLFKVEKLQNVPKIFLRPEIRMTLDYPEDLKFFETVINALSPKGEYFNLRDIINYLDKHPEVIKINQKMQEIFLANQKKKTHLDVKKGALKDGK
jgi:spore coat polysaccharide biosynthesis protein SpsF